MTQYLRSVELRQVGRDIFDDFGAHFGVQLIKELMIDFPAGSQKAAFHIGVARQFIQPLGHLANLPLAGFQFDIVPLTVGHSAAILQASSARKAPRQVGHLFNQPVVSLRVFEMIQHLQTWSPVQMIVIFQLECFETSEICHH